MRLGQSAESCHVSTIAQMDSSSVAILSQMDANLLPIECALKTAIFVGVEGTTNGTQTKDDDGRRAVMF